jgi:cytidylate kinase
MERLIITIDGPAGSGKSTVARMLAQRINAIFLDTGAMYRTVTLAAMDAKVNLEDQDAIVQLMDETTFRFSASQDKMAAFIDNKDVSDQIRSLQVTQNSKYIASAAKIREKLVSMQRDFASENKKIVTEGRDQGTVAFANAEVKFYMIADVNERAKRRQNELLAKGQTVTVDEIKKSIENRDASDINRECSPLKPAQDAILIDTTELNIEQVVDKLIYIIKEKGFI